MGFLENFYEKSPIFLQNALVSGYGIFWRNRRFGGVFNTELENFLKREKWSEPDWNSYQEKKLRTLLVHAFETVPFYRERYSKEGFKLEDFMNFKLKDISSLPYLEKDDLREFGDTLLISKIKDKGKFFSSSGSTGTPTKIYFSPSFHRTWSAAYEARCRYWAGVNRFNSRGMIGGRLVVPVNQNMPPYYRFNIAESQYYFSINHLSIHTVESYVNTIRKHKIEYFTGYANSVWLIAKYALDLDLPKLSLKTVITSSEKLTKAMRQDIEIFFGCKVYDTYSGVEACGLISECSNGNLHWSPDVAIMETLSLNSIDGNISELICTGLINFDQPLIRYRIGDLITFDKSTKCDCGREFPVINEIIGRTDDIITLKDGRQLGSFNRFFAEIKGIKKIQVIQMDYDRFQLNIVPSKEWTIESENMILQSFYKRIGKVGVEFLLVDEISTSRNGKFKAVISKVTFQK